MALKVFEGIVTSTKMAKTLVVSVNRRHRESRTGKIVTTHKHFKVHCEDTSVKVGDQVSFAQCRPISKDKKFRLAEVLQRAEGVASATVDEVV
jgi:small subunit ribosomal protein S17